MTAQSGMPDDARTAIMGHTSLDMTAHYTHWQPKALAFDAVRRCRIRGRDAKRG